MRERSAPTEPTPPAADTLTLKIGDSVRDSSGHDSSIIKIAAGGWATSDGTHISRADLKAGIYSKAEPITPEAIIVL